MAPLHSRSCLTLRSLGSERIVLQKQSRTVAARAITEKKVSEHRSCRVATRLRSCSRPNMVSIRLRRLYRRLSCFTDFLRDFRPGMHTFIPLSFNASRSQSASQPLSAGSQSAFGRLPEPAPPCGVVAYRTGGDEEPDRPPLRIGDRVPLGGLAARSRENDLVDRFLTLELRPISRPRPLFSTPGWSPSGAP